MWDLKNKTVYLSLAWTCTPHTKWGQSVTDSGVKSPGGHPEDLTLTTGYIQAICIALPHLYTHTDTHADTRRFEKGWHVCLGKGMLNVKFTYAVTPFLSSNQGMLAPMLLHLYSEEVRSKFCCLILQLIANRRSIALQHTATCRQPEHPMQLCKHKHHSL